MRKALLILFMLVSMTGVSQAATTTHIKVVTDSVYICQSKSAYAYHSHECKGLARCTHTIVKIPKAQAIKLGYKPCKICY